MDKKERTIVVLVLALVILVPSSLLVGYEYAVHAGIAIDNLTYGPGDVDTATYVIFKDGTNYYAKNGATRVVDFGPSTNCTFIVKSALDAMIGGATLGSSTYFGTMHFAKGLFEFDTEVLMVRELGQGLKEGLIVEGEGRYATALKAIGAHPIFNFTAESRNDRFESFVFRDLEFTSDQNVFTSEDDSSLVLVNATFVDIYDCYFERSGGGSQIWLEGLETNFIHSNGFAYSLSHGIVLYQVSDTQVYGNSFYECTNQSIRVVNAMSTSIIGNTITHSGKDGIYFYGVTKSTISNNPSIYANGVHGIMLALGSDNNTVTGNVVFENSEALDSGWDGIHLADASFNVVNSNSVFEDNTVAPRQGFGIRESGTSDYNMIIGNNLRIAGVYGYVFKIGANTKVGLCWNGSATWLAAPT